VRGGGCLQSPESLGEVLAEGGGVGRHLLAKLLHYGLQGEDQVLIVDLQATQWKMIRDGCDVSTDATLRQVPILFQHDETTSREGCFAGS